MWLCILVLFALYAFFYITVTTPYFLWLVLAHCAPNILLHSYFVWECFRCVFCHLNIVEFLFCFIYLLHYYYSFGHATQWPGFKRTSDQGLTRVRTILQWKYRILAIGLPEKSLVRFLKKRCNEPLLWKRLCKIIY